MRQKKIFRSAFFIVILAFIGLCLYASIRFSVEKRPIGAIDDPSRYAEIRNQYQDLMRHFPEAIPTDAVGVKFHFHPAFLQGGDVIQLRLRLSKDQIDTLVDEYSQKATQILRNGNVVKGGSEGSDIPAPALWVAEETEGFEKGYDTFFLYGESLSDENSPWNHGITYGAMINQAEQSVIYWVEEW